MGVAGTTEAALKRQAERCGRCLFDDCTAAAVETVLIVGCPPTHMYTGRRWPVYLAGDPVQAAVAGAACHGTARCACRRRVPLCPGTEVN